MNASYTQRMRTLGGIILIATLALSGCAAEPSADNAVSIQTVPAGPESDFLNAVRTSGSTYANLPDAALFNMAKEICEHYADGFTTEDLLAADGARLALVGEAARGTVCR